MVLRAIVLFTHAIICCTVTIRLFVMGKCFEVNKIKSDFHFCQEATASTKKDTQQDIIMAGEIALVSLNCGAKEEGLLRYRRLCDKISKVLCHRPQQLKSTASFFNY